MSALLLSTQQNKRSRRRARDLISFEQANRMLDAAGFIDGSLISHVTRYRLCDPSYRSIPARTVSFRGTGSYRGSFKFGTFDYFGITSMAEIYLVMDYEKFTDYMGRRLERMFLAKNPNPSRGLRSAFTRYLHSYSMHWSQCVH